MTVLSESMDASGLAVVTLDPATDPRWAALLQTRAAGLFHSPPWFRALADAYSFEVKAHVAVNAANVPQGGIAFCILADIFGRRVISLPFSDACDPLLVTTAAWPVLLRRLEREQAPLFLRCLDRSGQIDPHFAIIKRARWHTLSVVPDSGAIWAGFEGSARRAVRKAEHHGVVVRPLNGSDGLAEFHRLHVALRKRKYRLFAQPFEFFEAIKHRFQEVDGWFPLGAFVDDRLVAATLYLRWGDTLYYKFNASCMSSLQLRANNLLVWAGISLAQSLGCRELDLGPSDDDQPGLIRFKRQFGAADRELRFLCRVPPEWQDRHAIELHRLLADLTRLLTSPNVPDDVTREAGALLYRHFV
jgi:CelD/BcsL family acetyltransferase involved in cellulose biosynthesis